MDCYLDIFGSDNSSECNLPLSLEQISAGFPSPADDYMDLSLDLNKELIKNPSSTGFRDLSITSRSPSLIPSPT